MLVYVAEVNTEGPPTVKVIVAEQTLNAVWAGLLPQAGEQVDVEIEFAAPLSWGDTIGLVGAHARLRDGPRLRGVVESQEPELLTLRIAEGSAVVEVDDVSMKYRLVPPL